jgi:sulfide:quinone oxidoreductase
VSEQGPLRVLIAGGGVAALEAALALRALAGELVSVELLAPEPSFWYRPASVAEPFGLGESRHFELPELASTAGATFALGALAAVDADRHIARTAAGASVPYDVLLLACGAVPTVAVPGALTFRGPADVEKVRALLDELAVESVERVAFAVPWGAAWTLPAYELALMTAAFLDALEIRRAEVLLVTPEAEPLGLFGAAGTEAVRGLLDERRISLHTGLLPAEFVRGRLRLVPVGHLPVDRVVALPRLCGPRIDGLPQTLDGFVPVDAHGRVSGLDDVFAAGDITTFPTKQGGVAAQQADAAAEAIAAEAGADLAPSPFRPVLRGLLLTGGRPRYLEHELTGAFGDSSASELEPLWWPPAKIVGRYLSPFLGELVGVEAPREPPEAAGALRIEVELEADARAHALELEQEDGAGPTVAEIMSSDPLVVAPEDTLGEVAERMRDHDVGSVLVVDYGKLIGILTSRDLLRALGGRVHPSDARVRAWMTAEPIVARPDMSAAVAATLMTEHGVHRLPVVENLRPVGLVGLRQAVRAVPQPVGIGLGF